VTEDKHRIPLLLATGFALFVAVIALLIVPSFTSPNLPIFAPTPAGLGKPASGRLVTATVTIDAGDEHRWKFLSLDRGAVMDPPDTAGWDLAIRRFHLIPSGGIANLGAVAFESVARAPDAGYVMTGFGRDTSNTVTAHWYSYSYLSHLLTPKGEVYVVRTRGDRYAKLQILGYYCAGPTPGCLTIRYAYQGDGTKSLSR